jgi:tRNA (cmo5U34)-methyltransferase
MANATKEVFDRTASDYDRERALLIPGCDSFYRWAVDLIPAGAKSIIDLGAGSGLLTERVRERFPHARIELIDFSEAMLDLARKRLGDDPNLRYTVADYATDPLPGSVCSIVSSLSIHHLEHAAKRELFGRVFASLKPRGVFVNAEQVGGPTEQLDQRYRALWLDQVRAAGATEQQIADSLYRQQQDRCADVEQQLDWMRAAGFADADCWYKEGRFAVLAASKPAAGEPI